MHVWYFDLSFHMLCYVIFKHKYAHAFNFRRHELSGMFRTIVLLVVKVQTDTESDKCNYVYSVYVPRIHVTVRYKHY